MKKRDAEELLQKFQSGDCSGEELKALTYWMHHYRKNEKADLSAADLNKISLDSWIKINAEIEDRRPGRHLLWRRIASAAAILLIAIAVLFIYRSGNTDIPKQVSVYQNDIEPGKNNAYLLLANGKKISLNEEQSGIIDQESGITISKSADGILVYKLSGKDQSAPDAKNTLKTPEGGRFQVVLPDGTGVWLNAASSLTYPLSFKGKSQRLVELDGEGYFEVARNVDQPFLVRSGKQTVEVLGTHFNIQAYADEAHLKTTLISGSVKVYGEQKSSAKFLKPGQQSTFNGQNIAISAADTEQATAWVNDDFVFAGEDLPTVMRQISRWYDVDVEFVGKIGYSGFYSTISRKKKLSEILKALTLNQGVHFKIEGRRVTVMP